MADINLLKPKVKALANKLMDECNKANIPIIIHQTLRTIEEQNNLYAQGRTKPGEIVTNAKGGTSFHNYGVAFDFCPLTNGKMNWKDLSLFEKVGKIGIGLGLEWGGMWTDIIDRPHLQYTAGYKISDFINNRIDWSKFEVSQSTPAINLNKTAVKLRVIPAEGLRVRKLPDANSDKIGLLACGSEILPIQTSNGWHKIQYNNAFGWVKAEFVA